MPDGLSASARRSVGGTSGTSRSTCASIASIDDNIGRLLDWLDDDGIADDTIVVYTSDQGFFLGDHGWFDKRMMYEESFACRCSSGTRLMVAACSRGV